MTGKTHAASLVGDIQNRFSVNLDGQFVQCHGLNACRVQKLLQIVGKATAKRIRVAIVFLDVDAFDCY